MDKAKVDFLLITHIVFCVAMIGAFAFTYYMLSPLFDLYNWYPSITDNLLTVGIGYAIFLAVVVGVGLPYCKDSEEKCKTK